jgi:AsmA protein
MSLWIRRTLIALAALVAVFVALAIWLVATFNPDQYKSLAIDWMKANRNRTLAIEGPIKLGLFPRLELRLSKISLSEAGKADQFAALEEADLAVEVLPLLRGRVSVDRVQARGISVVLLRDAKGKRNIDDLVQPGPAAAAPPSAPAQPSQAPSQAIAIDIQGIRLADVRARIKDESAGIDGEVLLKEFSTGRIASRVATPVKMNVQFGLKSPSLKGELSGACVVTPDLETGSVSVTEMDLGFKGDAPGASGIDVAVKGALAFDAAKGAIEAKALGLRVTATAGTTQLTDSRIDIAQFSHDPGAKKIAVKQLKVRVAGTSAGKALAAELDWPELDVSGTTLKGSGLSGKLSLAGDTPIEAQFSSAAPSGNFDNLRIPGFEARVSSHAAARKIDATLRADFGLQTDKQTVSIDKLNLDVKLADPALKPVTLGLQGTAGASAQSARWNLTGQINASPFRADGTAQFGGNVPNVKANARFEALDLNSIFPAPPAAAPASAGTAPSAPEAPIDLSALRSVNGVFSLRAASVAARQFRVADLVLDAQLEAGVLRVGALQGKTWGGAIDASALADSRSNRVSVKANAAGVDVNALLKDVAGKDLLEGKGRVIADLDSAGRNVSEMKSQLKGSASVQLRDGALKGFNIAKSLRQAKAALSTSKDTAQRASQTEKTDFSEMSASFQIAGGVARSNDLDMKSPYIRVGGEGWVDIGKSQINYTARATVTDTSKGQDGSDYAALRGVTIPVKLSGPLEAMDWNIQWSAVAVGAAKNQLKDKLAGKLSLPAGAASAPAPAQQLKEKAQDKVKDKLKGLFK